MAISGSERSCVINMGFIVDKVTSFWYIIQIMAYRCELCDKKTRAGRQSKHHPGVAGQQWKRRAPSTIRSFEPNLHWVTLPLKGTLTRVKACTNCIKRVKFDLKKASLVAAPVVAA